MRLLLLLLLPATTIFSQAQQINGLAKDKDETKSESKQRSYRKLESGNQYVETILSNKNLYYETHYSFNRNCSYGITCLPLLMLH